MYYKYCTFYCARSTGDAKRFGDSDRSVRRKKKYPFSVQHNNTRVLRTNGNIVRSTNEIPRNARPKISASLLGGRMEEMPTSIFLCVEARTHSKQELWVETLSTKLRKLRKYLNNPLLFLFGHYFWLFVDLYFILNL